MRIVVALCCLWASVFCFQNQTHAAPPERPASLEDLSDLKRAKMSDKEKEDMEAFRPQVQKDTATAAAIKAGTRWRYDQILKEVVEPHAAELDALFNFSPLLIRRDDVTAAPPIVSRAGAALRVDPDGKVKVQKGSYQFIKSASIMTGVPTWRNYLYIDVGPDDDIHPSILPADAKEIVKWKLWVDEGWQLGIEQAEALFDSNMARLVRDYNGMLIYYSLSSIGMIEKPVITKTASGTIVKAREVIQDLDLYEMTKDGRFVKPPSLPMPRAKTSVPPRKTAAGQTAQAKTPPPEPAGAAQELRVPLPPTVKPLTAQEAGCPKSSGGQTVKCPKPQSKIIETDLPPAGSGQ